jgi:hypothetical protein
MDAIWNRARADLVIITEQGDEDLCLWEHSVRVAKNVRRIIEFPVVEALSPDEAAAVAAALYHEAGWVVRLREGEIRREEILCRSTSDAPWDLGAALLERRAAKLLPSDSLARASQAIRSLPSRGVESVEAQVVRDADHLDEFGVLSLWPVIRRGALSGKCVQAAIEKWHAQKAYHFWEARLEESFHFAPVRAVAENRLEKLQRIMEELQQQHEGADLTAEAVSEPAL